MANKVSALKSSAYILLLQSFIEWLQLLGYSPLSIPVYQTAIKDFLHYLEGQGKEHVDQIIALDATGFIEHLKTKTGARTGRPLTPGHINKQVQALKLLSRYLRETGRSGVAFNLQRLEEEKNKPVWLTQAEVGQLYQIIKDDVLGIRDRAMLAVFYGCGLRLNEGAHLVTSDILLDRKLLYVRKGKLYRERLVPIAEKNLEEIKLYLDYARPQLLQDQQTEAFFIDANKGLPMQKQSLYIRIKTLVKKGGIQKKVGTHTLRHSIATHLLQSGMKLERIQQFFFFIDMESTEIYTHL
jgi:site-specific recombinase XerD